MSSGLWSIMANIELLIALSFDPPPVIEMFFKSYVALLVLSVAAQIAAAPVADANANELKREAAITPDGGWVKETWLKERDADAQIGSAYKATNW
ncbi:hypothetical protein SISSUDRAFT_1130980 [Sistotremastrum suecicum HHB10207 ss-3]|uniref:Uncharacterized protein n=1 Tax=Sistotremastrum suecicum HHB10207 ss-3 TaxID=1314776 RepID=A0A166ARC3_9AGAM|nr:hypothetical protein SISSUDRAFT_1130980 [Sistotremastrum suecicum HHB10207 ss-3]